VDGFPEYANDTPLQAAQKENKSATIAALQAAGAKWRGSVRGKCVGRLCGRPELASVA